MGGSILAKLNDATLNFTYLYTFSTNKFINVHTAVVKNSLLAGLPKSTGEGLLIWGSGEYMESDPYLAFMQLESIEDKSTLHYFAGLAADGNPIWSKSESDAQPLFHDPVIGELSVAWNPYTTVLMQAQLKKSLQQVPEFPNTLFTILLCFVSIAAALCARQARNHTTNIK
jgi:hypothetical protein